MSRSDGPADTVEGVLSRRALLGMVGSGMVSVVSGCGTVEHYEFVTDPVVLPVDARRSLGYAEVLVETITNRTSRTVGGVDVEATVESEVAVYEAVGEDGPTVVAPSVGVVSTPDASVAGRSFNPLAHLSVSALLTSQYGNAFLRRAGLNRVGHDRDTVVWERGPERLAGRNGTCVGESGTIESFGGVLAGDSSTVVFVHVLRVDARSVVLTAAVHGRHVEDTERPYVGPDGYLEREQLATAAGAHANVARRFRYADD